MTPIDPTGRLVTFTRDAPAVAAITNRVSGNERGTVAGADNKRVPWDAPCVVVTTTVPGSPGFIGGAGSRSNLLTWRHALKCYAPKTQEGYRQAKALGLAVMTALHMAGPITFPTPGGGAGHGGIYQIVVEGSGGPYVDPGTGEPYVVVTTYLSATAVAIA